MHQPIFSLYEEERLVARCLCGEDTAWETMFRLYHPRLVSIIKAEMNWQCCTDQAEDIAASIWCSLCSEMYSRLRRYDPQVSRLLTYLRALSRREIWKRTREENSRRLRERRAARSEGATDDDDIERAIVVAEFLDILTSQEREFCQSYLMNQSRNSGQSVLSSTNGWKLRSRILKKLQAYVLDKS